MKETTILIPARRNSKGLPFKNRKLFHFTLNSIPEIYLDNVLVSTDDEWIIKECEDNNVKYHIRKPETSDDLASTKSVIEEISEKLRERVVMLYLTYPERTWENISDCLSFYEENNGKSLLCKKQLKTSPFLMMYDCGIKGKQIIEHNLYRRQDYPECFEISHFISIFSKKELKNLNNNLYNEDTIFYSIDDVVDIDLIQDLEEYNEKNKNNS